MALKGSIAVAINVVLKWCDAREISISTGRKVHVLTERDRVLPGKEFQSAVTAHYEDPLRLADRISRLGFKKASGLLKELLPKSKKGRSGHLGEILATETVPALLPPFSIPIKRLRWLDHRELALRGEDLIGIAFSGKRVRFLKGESKSGGSVSDSVISSARASLKANNGRPSQHGMAFVMNRLFEQGDNQLGRLFEEHLVGRSIAVEDVVHLMFTFSGNDASDALERHLRAYTGKIEQHAVNLRVEKHQAFISRIYKDLAENAAKP